MIDFSKHQSRASARCLSVRVEGAQRHRCGSEGQTVRNWVKRVSIWILCLRNTERSISWILGICYIEMTLAFQVRSFSVGTTSERLWKENCLHKDTSETHIWVVLKFPGKPFPVLRHHLPCRMFGFPFTLQGLSLFSCI